MRDKVTDYYGQEHTLPGPFHTLDMLKGANMAKGGHYFDRDTMRFFGSRVAPGVIAGRIFITSEQDRSPYAQALAWNGERRYTVRVMSDDGDVTDLGPDKDTFGAFATLREARAWVRRYLEGKEESCVAEWARKDEGSTSVLTAVLLGALVTVASVAYVVFGAMLAGSLAGVAS